MTNRKVDTRTMTRKQIDPRLQAEMDRRRFAARRVPIPDEDLDLMRPYDITPPDPESVRNTWRKFLKKMGWEEEGVSHGNK